MTRQKCTKTGRKFRQKKNTGFRRLRGFPHFSLGLPFLELFLTDRVCTRDYQRRQQAGHSLVVFVVTLALPFPSLNFDLPLCLPSLVPVLSFPMIPPSPPDSSCLLLPSQRQRPISRTLREPGSLEGLQGGGRRVQRGRIHKDQRDAT